jgi:hypothetical protein
VYVCIHYAKGGVKPGAEDQESDTPREPFPAVPCSLSRPPHGSCNRPCRQGETLGSLRNRCSRFTADGGIATGQTPRQHSGESQWSPAQARRR